VGDRQRAGRARAGGQAHDHYQEWPLPSRRGAAAGTAACRRGTGHPGTERRRYQGGGDGAASR
jgi:hypothetical protein